MLLQHYLMASVNEANIYLIACEATGHAMLIDAAALEPAAVELVRARNLDLRAILITHGHYDHISGLGTYAALWPKAAIVAGAPLADFPETRIVGDQDSFALGKIAGKALRVPGHTPDSVVYSFEEARERKNSEPTRVLFTGDVLFAGSIGGTVGSAMQEQEIQGIRSRIFTLPDSVLICPGHGPASTVGIERQYNPFFIKPAWEKSP